MTEGRVDNSCLLDRSARGPAGDGGRQIAKWFVADKNANPQKRCGDSWVSVTPCGAGIGHHRREVRETRTSILLPHVGVHPGESPVQKGTRRLARDSAFIGPAEEADDARNAVRDTL